MAQRKQHCEVMLKKTPTHGKSFIFMPFLNPNLFPLLDHLDTNICLTLLLMRKDAFGGSDKSTFAPFLT